MATFCFRQIDNDVGSNPIMAKDKETIIKELKDHIASRGGAYSEWYTGIAEDAKKRLDEHGLNRKEGDKWAHREATSSDTAREIETYFTETLGIDGDSGGGTDASKFVYIYKKNINTNP